jgi:nucleoid DNA-binding protein|tara:strand:- start:7598 stop:7873 length:276 start_codon:yes stop_codon:yes gene_type:complete
MSLGKKDIEKNISSKTQLSLILSKKILNSFLFIIKEKSTTNTIKISNFGTFRFEKTKSRLGRNPKTKENFLIQSFLKFRLKPSQKIKDILN